MLRIPLRNLSIHHIRFQEVMTKIGEAIGRSQHLNAHIIFYHEKKKLCKFKGMTVKIPGLDTGIFSYTGIEYC